MHPERGFGISSSPSLGDVREWAANSNQAPGRRWAYPQTARASPRHGGLSATPGRRRKRAFLLLRDGQPAQFEIAFLLGFNVASAFTRALRRWSGGDAARLTEGTRVAHDAVTPGLEGPEETLPVHRSTGVRTQPTEQQEAQPARERQTPPGLEGPGGVRCCSAQPTTTCCSGTR